MAKDNKDFGRSIISEYKRDWNILEGLFWCWHEVNFSQVAKGGRWPKTNLCQLQPNCHVLMTKNKKSIDIYIYMNWLMVEHQRIHSILHVRTSKFSMILNLTCRLTNLKLGKRRSKKWRKMLTRWEFWYRINYVCAMLILKIKID